MSTSDLIPTFSVPLFLALAVIGGVMATTGTSATVISIGAIAAVFFGACAIFHVVAS